MNTENTHNADMLKVAIVGRPNVGKSTLFNILSTDGKAIVHSMAGVTRDAREVTGQLFDLDFILVDTAGLRKRTKVKENIEFYSTVRTAKLFRDVMSLY